MTHKGNNVIPNAHFHKKWQRRVKTWFNQPARKYRRRMTRKKKALKIAPRPLRKVRPAVRCPTIRHQLRLRQGRGFTLEEVKRVGLCPEFARTIGIPVDCRRRNKSYESLGMNVGILKEYLHRLILFPKRENSKLKQVFNKKEATKEEQNMALQLRTKSIVPLKDPISKFKARVVSDEEKKFSPYAALRKARIDLLLVGKRAKKLQEGLENPDAGILSAKAKKKSDKD